MSWERKRFGDPNALRLERESQRFLASENSQSQFLRMDRPRYCNANPMPPADSLSTYRAKRSPDRTPEPVGTGSPVPGTCSSSTSTRRGKLHFDLRLEMDGVLRSWAVPKGPVVRQADKRLAVKVEDHPLEYGDFEGIIPGATTAPAG